MTDFLALLYLLAMIGLSLYGFLGLLTLCLYWQHRRDTFPRPEVAADALPLVTVQLPVYNERYVVERLIEAAVSLDYPCDRLQIQVLDDSTDDTTQKAAALVNYYQEKGSHIDLLRRSLRTGYKAGALNDALPFARGEFIAIFDADFLPPPDFLRRTIPYFCCQPRLGMVQARWGHLNANASAMTGAQAIALDKHFAIEQVVRHRASLFPKFNGTAGVWRRACLEEVGGWEDDTVCEDLCLSTRAILKQWEFCFLNDVEAPAELPASMTAYKNQQARWAKGSMQCLLKHGRSILQDRYHPFAARLYALLSMLAYVTHLLLLLIVLLQVPLIYLDYHFSGKLAILGLVGMGQPLLFILGQQALYPDWRRRLRHLPTLLLMAVGVAPSNCRALLQAVFSRQQVFVRTPKTGSDAAVQSHYQLSDGLPFDWIVVVEILLTLYAGYGIYVAIAQGNFGSLFFLITCFLGFGYVASLSFCKP